MKRFTFAKDSKKQKTFDTLDFYCLNAS